MSVSHAGPLRHGLTRMRGRDPSESHRAATPLELLFDLTFVIAFGTAADELAHFLAEDHVREGLIGFAFSVFAISWAWINFSWFASAYDTDDWVYRLTTMVQMIGVLVLALGIPATYESLLHGDHLDNKVVVAGYVIMRIAMVAQWLRAARQDPDHRRVANTYVLTIVLAQVLWVGLVLLDLPVGPFFLIAIVPYAVEVAGPMIAELRLGGSPWHPHHIAERYSLIVIIALGEGLIGTTASLNVLVGPEGPGWSVDVGLLAFAGVALTFGIWWTYFVLPHGALLAARREERAFGWGYGHIVLFGSIVAVGAGLHVAAYLLGDDTALGRTATVLTVAVPVAVYVAMLYVMYALLTRTFDPFHVPLVAASAVCVAAAVLLADTSMTWALVVLAATPWVTVVGYELIGHRHNADVLDHLERR
ncbi:low temperature requirement protein A [Nocardioides sp. LHG3406-4]|uniref:low temperature requirement protein A n=1 Tax=Nocardioides sp. LHG3406-4 TaxID=2804575 RepID=UPI003CEA9D87